MMVARYNDYNTIWDGRCLCGALDCPECYPGCLEEIVCEICGDTKPRFEMYDSLICGDCHDAGYGICEHCGEAEILFDGKQCSECWAEEVAEALS